MRKILLSAAAAAAAVRVFAAAPVPVAAWNKDFSPEARSAFEGYTLEDWNLTHGGIAHAADAEGVDYSSVTIDRDSAGLMFNASSGMPELTILVRYSGLAASESAKRVIVTSSVSAGASRTGLSLSTSGISGTWNNTAWTGADSQNAIPSSGVLAFTYKGGSGTYLYYGATLPGISSSSLYGASDLHSSNDSSIIGASIGGLCANTAILGHEAAKGMTITALAVFDKVFSVDEMKKYSFPGEEPSDSTYTLALSGIDTTWSTGAWTLEGSPVAAPVQGRVKIVSSASTVLTIDEAVALSDIEFEGSADVVTTVVAGNGGSLCADSATISAGVVKQGSNSVFGTTPAISVASGATFDVNACTVDNSTVIYIAGAGAGAWPWALTSSADSIHGVKTVTLTANATIGGPYMMNLGVSSVANNLTLGGFTLTKTGEGRLLCYNVRTIGGGTLDLRGGTTSFREWTSLDGYETIDRHTTVVVRNGAVLDNNANRWLWIDTLEMAGGSVTSSSSTDIAAFGVSTALNGSGTAAKLRFNNGVAATLDGDLAVSGSLVLTGSASFLKSPSAASDVTVSLASLVAESGTVSIGPGVTFDIGTSRPGAALSVDDGAVLAVHLASGSSLAVLNVPAKPANVVLYDESGAEVENPNVAYDAESGTVRISAANMWSANDGVSFDNVANWSADAVPLSGDKVSVAIDGDTEIAVQSEYALGGITIAGSGRVSFAGAGSIEATSVSVGEGVTLELGDASALSASAIAIESGSVLDIVSTSGVFEMASAISGAGAVETDGDVRFTAGNSFTGGLTVKTGTASTTQQTGFAGSDGDGSPMITVEDGACLDIANTQDYGHVLTIAGNGVLEDGVYSGAVKNSGSVEFGAGTRQTKQIILAADAMVDVSTGWGLVRSDHNESYLSLGGHTLVVRGSGVFPVINAVGAAGTLVIDGATLQFNNGYANRFGNTDIIVKNGGSLDFTTAPSAVKSLVFMPSASAPVTATAFNIPEGLVPAISTAAIDPDGTAAGDALTLFRGPEGSQYSAELFEDVTGSRYEMSVSGNEVSATVVEPDKFMHYDFDSEGCIAADSLYNFGSFSGLSTVAAKNGNAGVFTSTPYYDSNTAGVSPFHLGEMTVVSILKVREASNTILWNMGSAFQEGIALVAKNQNTVALVSWTGGAAGEDVVSATGLSRLGSGWHVAAVVANANGTTLYVDGVKAETSATIPSGISQVGQFGSIHGGAKNYSAVRGDGFLLDDWRVYDTALSAAEITAIRSALNPSAFRLYVR